MKKIKFLFAVLYLTLIFCLFHYEAFAIGDNVREKPSRIDSMMKNTEVDLRIDYAFFVHHHFNMTAYPKHFPIFELSLQKQTYGNKLWHSYFNYPTVGVTAFFSTLGNIDIIGKAYALYPFINFPFNKSKTNIFSFRFGAGIGYLTKKFDPLENYHNTSIGSNINAAINMTFEYQRRISERFKMSLFAGLTHFSNGCSSTPNSGINIINAGISTTYLLKEQEDYIPRQKNSNREYRKIEPEFYIGMSYGVKRIEYGQTEDFSVFNLEFYAMDRVTNLSKVGIGLDLVSDATDKMTLRDFYYDNNEYTFAQLLKPGIGAAYELIMSDASLLVNFGYHPWGRDMRYGRWYQKLGLKVNFGKYIYGKIALNTHFGVADFIGFGLGARL